MKPGDLVTVDLNVAHAYLQGRLAEYQNQIFTIVEIVEKDVDVPEHIIVLTAEGLKKLYKEDVKVINECRNSSR
jgi:hypothetical protein